MLTTQRRFLAMIGIEPDGAARASALAVGVRELTAFVTIVGMRHRRVGAWSRVGGDAIDLTLLGVAFARRRRHAARLAGAIAFVAAIMSTDLFVALRLSAAEGAHIDDGSGSQGVGAPPDRDGGATGVRTAITVRVSEDEARQRFRQYSWSTFDPAALEHSGAVRFEPAPGDRGTEVHVNYDPPITGGPLGALALKLAGRSPDQKINDDLRRFKALVETGVDVRSDKTPAGPSAAGQIFQRPGQPVKATAA